MSANSSENQPHHKEQSYSKPTESPSKNSTSSNSESQQPSKTSNNQQAAKSLDFYTFGKTIGQGTFGKVKLAIHKLTGEKVAIKILEKSKIANDADVERITREIHILKQIRHPHIIQLYEIIETSSQLFLVMEYADGGELFNYIVSHKRIREREASQFFQEIIAGVEYVHKLGIVHRDLKPENLLLNHNKHIKIVDFGLSNIYKEGELLKTACGSPCYAAPEMIAGKKYKGLGADIWSCGIVLFALVCGYLPFEDPNTSQLYKKILKGEFNVPKFVSAECNELLNCILTTDPARRYTIEDIRRHPWFNHVKPIKEVQGIIIGVHNIPIDYDMLNKLNAFKFDIKLSEKLIRANKHNHITTLYYLLLKRHLLNGGKSPADINSSTFDITLLTKSKLSSSKAITDNFVSESEKSEKKGDPQKKNLGQSTKPRNEPTDKEKPIRNESESEQTRGRSCPIEKKSVNTQELGSTGGSFSRGQDFSGVNQKANLSATIGDSSLNSKTIQFDPSSKRQSIDKNLKKLFPNPRGSSREGRDEKQINILGALHISLNDKQNDQEILNNSITRDNQASPQHLPHKNNLQKPRPPSIRNHHKINPRINSLLNGSVEKERAEENSRDVSDTATKNYQMRQAKARLSSSAINQRNLIRQNEQPSTTANESEYQRPMTSSTIEEGNRSTIQSTPTHHLAKRSRGIILTEMLNNSKDFSFEDNTSILYTQESTKAKQNTTLNGSYIVDALNSSVYKISLPSKSPSKNPKATLVPKEPVFSKINNAAHISNIYRNKLFLGNHGATKVIADSKNVKIAHPTTASGTRPDRGRPISGNFYDYRKFGTPSYESRDDKSINTSTLDHSQIQTRPVDDHFNKRTGPQNISFEFSSKKNYGRQDLNATMFFPGPKGKKYRRNEYSIEKSLNGTNYFGLLINQKQILK